MAYLLVGGTRSRCSCDHRSSVDPTATGHYENYSPEYHGSADPCGLPWDYYVTTYGRLVHDGHVRYERATVPFKEDVI